MYSVSSSNSFIFNVWVIPFSFSRRFPFISGIWSKKDNLDYGKIGTGKSGLGTIKSEIDAKFDFKRGSVGLARSLKYNTEDSQFFIILRDEPLYETEYTPIGKVIYGLEALEKIKYLDKSQYVLRPDFINSLRMLVN